MKYEQPIAGGSWDHRSGDCAEHGGNIAFARPHRSEVPYRCVQCMLRAAQRMADMKQRVDIVLRGSEHL